MSYISNFWFSQNRLVDIEWFYNRDMKLNLQMCSNKTLLVSVLDSEVLQKALLAEGVGWVFFFIILCTYFYFFWLFWVFIAVQAFL